MHACARHVQGIAMPNPLDACMCACLLPLIQRLTSCGAELSRYCGRRGYMLRGVEYAIQAPCPFFLFHVGWQNPGSGKVCQRSDAAANLHMQPSHCRASVLCCAPSHLLPAQSSAPTTCPASVPRRAPMHIMHPRTCASQSTASTTCTAPTCR